MYFLVPKKTGDLHPILNLKLINGLIASPKFKMEMLASVIKGLVQGDWVAAVDLKDVYFKIQLYLQSHWNRATQGLEYLITVSQAVFNHLQWWTDRACLLSGMPLSLPPAPGVITTNASSLIWEES